MWPNPQETKDLVTFTEEIFNEKLHFLCNVTQVFYCKFCEISKNTFFCRTPPVAVSAWR